MARGLFVHTSNRLEELAEALATVLHAEPLPPLTDEVVVVPSQGIARWLRQFLAEQHGIAAGLELPFPGALLQRLAGGRDEPDLFGPEVLSFRIWRLLADARLAAQLGPAVEYVADDPDDRKRLQLCVRIASRFDDYQLYRPELLRKWAAGDDTAALGLHAPWQARLWRALLADAGLADDPTPRAAKRRRRPEPTGPLLFAGAPTPVADVAHRVTLLRQRLADAARAASLLPPRLCVFGTGTLPPAFVQLLAAAAAHVPVHVFAPQPTPQHAADPTNALLARFGRQARDFAEVLVEAEQDAPPGSWHRFDLATLAGREANEQPATLLQCLQRDVAADADRGAAGGPARFELRDDDDSVRVHDCHSPQRELEVVRDQILAAFEDDDTLQPHDVLVLVPDVDRYAPFAHAVFTPVREHLPFRVADKSPASELPVCASVFAMLQLARERLQASDVLHLLDEPSVQRRFRIFGGDLPWLRARCEAAGIRWGLDGPSRERTCKVPAFDENAWLPGLERMLFGVATGPCDDLVLGVMPVADATSGREDLLARFLHFARTLFAQLDGLMRPQTLPAWADRIDALTATMHEADGADDTTALDQLRAATARLRRLAEHASFAQPVHAIVAQDWLRDALRGSTGPRGFLAGAVTIAAMLPMRAVPVRCLFVCGLDDASFPRRDRAVAFDLIAAHPARGDRSLRSDDHQMFLDALLSAREKLHLCFVGRSQKDDSECAPSTALAELLDQIDRSCTAPAGSERPRDAVLVPHPLQPWSPRYRDGDDPRLFTFTRADLEATSEPIAEPPWFDAAAEQATPPAAAVSLAALLEFWWHPCRYYLRHVARIRLPREHDGGDAMEPFAVGPLDRWRLQTDAVARALRGAPPPADPAAHMRATGLLPVGGLGEAAFLEVDDEVQRFLGKVRAHGDVRSRPLAVVVDATTVTGEISGAGEAAIVYARIARLKPKDHLRAWLSHVFAAAARAAGDATWPTKTVLIAKDKTLVLRALDGDDAQRCARELLDGFRRGQAGPLPFFEWSSHEFGKKVHEGKRDAAMRAARAKWEPLQPDSYDGGDSEDADIRLCWRGRDPLEGSDFRELAERVWATVHGFSGEAE